MIYLTEIFHYCTQVKDTEHRLRHKPFPPNAWMKLMDFNVLTSCPKDELHQWFLGLYGEHIISAVVHRYSLVLQRPDLIWHDRNGLLIQSYPMRPWPGSSGALPTDFRLWWQTPR